MAAHGVFICGGQCWWKSQRLINRNGKGNGNLWQWHWDNGNKAMAMIVRANCIDWLIVWVWGGHGRLFFEVLFQNVCEWQNGGANKWVTYLFDYIDYSLFQFVQIFTSECSEGKNTVPTTK
jgi:hypothetical protein